MGRAARNKDTGLTDKEEVFCQQVAYEPEQSDSDSYREAYNCSKMKPETVNNKAYQLKNKDVIRARITQLRKERSERTKIDADYVLNRHKEIDQLDIFDIVTDDLQRLKPLTEWPKAWRTSLNGFDVSELFEYIDGDKELSGFLKKIKMPDKLKNLELMGKHVDVQAYKEQVKQESTVKHNIMVVPTAASAEDWEAQAAAQQNI